MSDYDENEPMVYHRFKGGGVRIAEDGSEEEVLTSEKEEEENEDSEDEKKIPYDPWLCI